MASGGFGSAPMKVGPYVLGPTLGVGSFGRVKLAEHEQTGTRVAVKILNRHMIRRLNMDEKVKTEIKILELFMHPHIIRLYEVIETPNDIFVVTEYSAGGELYDFIVERGRLTEDVARKFFQQIISGVEYCHQYMIAHRDLKPENLLLDMHSNVKIADFGLSNVMRDGCFLKTSCGSPNYAAPEVISGKLYAGPEVDVWSCGVIVYALLCGNLPFEDDTIPSLFNRIRCGKYIRPSYLSEQSRDLIERMLETDPMRRITIPEIRRHPWFATRLPRYLSVPPRMGYQTHRIDESVLKLVHERTGYAPQRVRRALRRNRRNCYTVAYHLLNDSVQMLERSVRESGAWGNAGAGGSESGSCLRRSGGERGGRGGSDSAHGGDDSHPQNGYTPSSIPFRTWYMGIPFLETVPGSVMREVYRALHALSWSWKTGAQQPFLVKVLVPPMNFSERRVRIRLQLYQVSRGLQLDVQKHDGDVFSFLKACNDLFREMRV